MRNMSCQGSASSGVTLSRALNIKEKGGFDMVPFHALWSDSRQDQSFKMGKLRINDQEARTKPKECFVVALFMDIIHV